MTGRRIVDGLLTVTDGFWDSYRASWPLRTLIAPVLTGRLLEGFVEHYRDGGWVSRWSAPAPADIMTGTSSDAVFADAAIAGIGELGDYSVLDAYDSCLRNATVPSDNRFVGRKGMDRSMFTGYADTHAHEGLSWTIDAAINDASIAAFSAFLRHRHPDHERAAEFAANATWFAARAARYALMFDAQTDFFRGREPVSEGLRSVPGGRASSTRVTGAPTTPRPMHGALVSPRRRTGKAWRSCTAAERRWSGGSTSSWRCRRLVGRSSGRLPGSHPRDARSP